jgi:hypothetical protein
VLAEEPDSLSCYRTRALICGMDILGMIRRPVVSVRVTLGKDDVRGLRLICHKPRESSPAGFALGPAPRWMSLAGGNVDRVLPPDSASAMAVIVAAWSAPAGALAAIKSIAKTASLIGAVRDTIVLHPPSPCRLVPGR